MTEKKDEVELLTISEVMKRDLSARNDEINSFYSSAKAWIGWITFIIPFRVFHVFFWMFMYGMMYWLLRGCEYIGLKFIRRFMLWWVVEYVIIFTYKYIKSLGAILFMVVFITMGISYFFKCLKKKGFYKKNHIKVEEKVFKEVCLKYQKVEGKKYDREPYVIISNHCAFYDGILYFRCFGEIGIVVKKELARDAVVGPMLEELGCIFVGDRKKGEKGMVEILKEKCEKWYKGEKMNYLLCFPEGTTTNGNQMLRFHSGAFVPGYPVKPMMLCYQYKYFDPSFSLCKSALQYFEQLHSQLYNTVYIVNFPAYNPTEEERKNPKLYAENLRNVMCDIYNYYLGENVRKMGLSNIKVNRKKKTKPKFS